MNEPRAKSERLIENRRVIVTRWTFAPGEATGPHVHAHDYVVVPLSTGKLHIVASDGAASDAGLPVSELVRLRALGRPVVSRTDATTIRELRRLGGLLKVVHLESGGAYSEQTGAALGELRAAIARVANMP